MEQESLIEPDRLSGSWMDRKRMADLCCPKPVVSLPFASNFMLLAICLDLFFVVRLKHCLPRNIEAWTVIPHIHHFLPFKLLSNGWFNASRYSDRVGNRRLSSFFRRLQA